jgi:hypothetical protein
LKLEEHFKDIYTNGTRYGEHGRIKYTHEDIKSFIPSSNIAFYNKNKITLNQINGLEIADLLSNPALHYVKQLMLKKIRKRPIFDMRNDNFLENEIIAKIIKPKEWTISWQP